MQKNSRNFETGWEMQKLFDVKPKFEPNGNFDIKKLTYQIFIITLISYKFNQNIPIHYKEFLFC